MSKLVGQSVSGTKHIGHRATAHPYFRSAVIKDQEVGQRGWDKATFEKI